MKRNTDIQGGRKPKSTDIQGGRVIRLANVIWTTALVLAFLAVPIAVKLSDIQGGG